VACDPACSHGLQRDFQPTYSRCKPIVIGTTQTSRANNASERSRPVRISNDKNSDATRKPGTTRTVPRRRSFHSRCTVWINGAVSVQSPAIPNRPPRPIYQAPLMKVPNKASGPNPIVATQIAPISSHWSQPLPKNGSSVFRPYTGGNSISSSSTSGGPSRARAGSIHP
jgi:hypothetical protein